ncbi:hypothetical protein PIB30_053468 [Stylosanthes scabra]|uniref:NAC domain-containing protein n=1 Tax=Stylosanthes scabra TaxID=79078 RepID=A0ABU6WIY7_9FABA|nr:hypothetical protein [Stylosanthes scabra]
MDVAKLYMNNNEYSEEHEHEDEDDEMMKKEEKEEEEVVLPGFRFHPTDEELVGFYLRRKVEKKPLKIELIKHVDIYKYDPWDLPKVSSSMGEKEWYFFCIRGRKYRNSIRPNRVTGSGFWKATGIDKPIYSVNYKYNNNNNSKKKEEEGDHHECIGLKKSLVYYRGSAGKGTKTDWMMHEFRLPLNNNNNGAKLSNNNNQEANAAKDLHEAEVWTLCRIFKRIPTYKKYTPSLKDSSSASPLIITNKPINNINHQTDSSVTSISCSLESDTNNNSKPFLTFTNTMDIQQCERKPLVDNVDERNNFLLDHGSLHQQAPTTTTATTTTLSSSSSLYSSWNQHHVVEDYLFANENWDDLRSVVEFATDPNNNSKVFL